MTSKINNYQLAKYGFLAAPVAFAGFPLYIIAPDFYATSYGISLSVLGLVLLGLRAFDAVQDPFIGMISDRFAKRIFPIIIIAAIFLCFAIYALFHPITSHIILWFAITMLIAVTAYSIITINLNVIGALWTKDQHHQTRISSSREAFGLIGLLIAVILPGILAQYLPKEDVFSWFSYSLAGFMMIALIVFGHWFFSNKIQLKPEVNRVFIWKNLYIFPKKTRYLFLVYGLSVLASSIPAILVIFFIRDLLNGESYIGLFLLLYFGSGALTMFIWRKLSISRGKHQAWLISMLLAVSSFIWAFFLDAGDIWQYAAICMISGIALGADLALPPSILADDIYKYHLEENAAIQFSILALLTKVGLAIGSAIALPFLDLFGFVPAANNSDAALLGLSAAYALIPCLIKLSSAYLLYRLFIINHKE